ncbi:MAG: hypothetical protein KKD65_11900 [Gammaproteobacteria bacterium]|nr:hypothetical protein [Gammaproteobacteria bacterium]
MSLNELLFERKLTTALIVDDGYDEVPKAQDLIKQGAAWENFFADIGESDKDIIVESFPKYEEIDADDLRLSDDFVATIWSLRKTLRPELSTPLFEEYEQASKTDQAFLSKLESALRAVGIEPIQAGRDIPAAGKTVSIIFADLFLGSAQNDSDLEASLIRLKELLTGREASPPLVILMSSSPRLSEKKTYFRDKAHLLGAMFRVLSKNDLTNDTRFSQVLTRLALHNEDALRLASFLHCWDVGLDEAKSRFLAKIRCLDLADYAQIRQLLLNFEGQPLGSYVLDVFDRMLQHEIEFDAATIHAAKELNKIHADSYPPPYIAGSPDLQQLVYQTIYQNPKRLDVPTTESGAPVSFGDIIVKRTSLVAPVAGASPATEDSDVLVVLTPACDLARSGFRQALMISGKFEQLSPKAWTYKSTGTKTPIIILPDGRRMWIRWDLKDIQTLERDELNVLLVEGGTHQILIRLRETHAIELQQKLLADLGRVGLVARMPATFAVSVEAYTLNTESKLQPLSLPTLQIEGGVCYMGRDIDGNSISRLGLSEAAIDELALAIAGIDKTTINQKSQETLARLKSAATLPPSLHVPDVNKNGYITLTYEGKDANGGMVQQVIGLIARNPTDTESLKPDVQKHGALVLIVRDQ